LNQCYKTNVQRPRVVGSNLAVSETLGYGVGLDGCFNVKVHGGIMRECRRGIDVGGSLIPSLYCDILENTVQGGGVADDGVSKFWPDGAVQCDGIGSHGGAEGTTYAKNKLLNVRAGTLIRGRNEIVSGNLYIGKIETPIELVYGAGIQILDNEYKDQIQRREGTVALIGGVVTAESILARPARMVYINVNNYDLVSGLLIERNKAHNLRGCFAYFDGNEDKSIQGLIVRDNSAFIQLPSAGLVSLLKANSTKYIPRVILRNNDMRFPGDHVYEQLSSIGLIFLSTSASNIGNGVYHATILDDEAVKITTGFATGQKVIRIISASSNATPILNKMLRNNSTTEIEFGGSSGFTVSSVELTGTTGVDGAWTVSHFNNSIYIENRSGATRAVLVEIIG
jgi:hypothetical protein